MGISTKFGNASIDKNGYYIITSVKEGNRGKRLHRLIYEDFHGVTLSPKADIHHIDGDKLNNHPDNLELLSHGEHSRQHMLGDRNPMKSEDARLKLSKYRKGRKIVDKSIYVKQSKSLSTSQNSLRIYRLSKIKCADCKYGYRFVYSVFNEGKSTRITSVNLLKLKQKVIDKKYDWAIVNKEKAKITAEAVGLTLNDLI